jgi:phospholipid/cholesterol/gamma-HCH transport system substrate-binding protein
MAKQTRKYFVVGLFVTLAFLIAAAAIIWINASRYFEKGTRYVTFFDESVQGLSKDSEVKYQGVTVGRVLEINIAPDNKTVAVTMLVNLRGNLSQKVVAQLNMTGITGLMFINLVPRQPNEPDMSPKITFATEYPVISSKPSEISQILTGIKDVVESVKRADLEGTIKEIKEAAAALRNLADRKDIKEILAKVDGAAGYLREVLKKVDKTVTTGKIDGLLAEARQALKGAGTLMDGLNTDVKALKLPETTKKARLTLDDARALIDKLKRTSATLDQLIERLYQRPPDIFFGKPPKGRVNEQPVKPK